MEMRKIAEGIQPRMVAESDLWFDPLQPQKPETDDADPPPRPSRTVNALALKNIPQSGAAAASGRAPSVLPALSLRPNDHSRQL